MATEYARHGTNAVEQHRLGTVQNLAGKFGNHSRPSWQPLPPSGGLSGGPILCVNVWQHMYLRDYGVGTGAKKRYLQNWWDKRDWGMVEQSAYHYNNRPSRVRGGDFQRHLARSMSRF